MRRNALTRITTVLYAVWFVVALGVQTSHPCPTHDASSPGAHAVMAGMSKEPGAAQAPAHGPSHAAMHHACTCVGCCCVTAIDLGSARTVRVPASRIVAASHGSPGGECLTAASRAARLLPFANGPPAASSVTA